MSLRTDSADAAKDLIRWALIRSPCLIAEPRGLTNFIRAVINCIRIPGSSGVLWFRVSVKQGLPVVAQVLIGKR